MRLLIFFLVGLLASIGASVAQESIQNPLGYGIDVMTCRDAISLKRSYDIGVGPNTVDGLDVFLAFTALISFVDGSASVLFPETANPATGFWRRIEGECNKNPFPTIRQTVTIIAVSLR